MVKKELEVKDEYLKKLDKIEKEHFKKHGYKHMTVEELRKLFEGN